ncbi:hypothetical protein CR513_32255, partial [Mucuna pruriens]
MAERKNRHILKITRVCLIDAHMSSTSWGDAIFYAVYLMNRVPSSVLKFKTPLEKLSAYVNIPSNLTLAPRFLVVLCLFTFININKPSLILGYKCYHPPTKQFYMTMDVNFSKSEMYLSSHSSTSTLQGETYSKER